MACCDFYRWLLVQLVVWTLSGCATVVFLLFAVLRYKRNKTFDHLKKFPGSFESIPLLKQFRGHCNFLNAEKQTGIPYGVHMHHAINGVVLKHQLAKEGALVDYVGGLPTVFVFKAATVEDVLTHTSNISKGFGYKFLVPWLGNGLLLTNQHFWKTQRRMLTPAFHFRILDEFSRSINAQTRIFLDKIASHKPNDDIVPAISALTLDITCETIMGSSLACQTSDIGLKYLESIHTIGELVLDRAQHPVFWNDFLYNLTDKARLSKQTLDIVHSFTRKVIEDRKLEILSKPELLASYDDEAFTKSKKPFLDMMLQKHLNGELSLEDVRSQVDTFMFAGHDTTSMALTYAIYLIGTDREVQKKLHDEVDRVFNGQDRDVNSDDIRELKYLEMVIKESQRLLPSVPMIGRSLDEDMTIDGKTVPKGSDVTVMIRGLHYDAEVFPKPEEFNPERFSPEGSKNRHPFAFTPFSAGPRNCIGQKFALLEEKIVLSWLLRRFEWKSLDHRDELLFVYEIVMRPRSKIRIAFRRRKTSMS